jgi:hypothetical protein
VQDRRPLDRYTAPCANYVRASSLRHAAVFTLFGVAEKPYDGLAARSAAKEQSLTSQGRCPSRVLEYWDIKGKRH